VTHAADRRPVVGPFGEHERPSLEASPRDATRAPLLLSARTLAELLDVSTRTVWRLESSGSLPRSVRVAGSRKWLYEEVAEWVRAGCPTRARWEATRSTRQGSPPSSDDPHRAKRQPRSQVSVLTDLPTAPEAPNRTKWSDRVPDPKRQGDGTPTNQTTGQDAVLPSPSRRLDLDHRIETGAAQ
jgi:predicted DNA-binding transcriptional regulator AlpA